MKKILNRGFLNLIVGILSQGITLTLGIVIPKIYVDNLGSEVNGLMTTVTQIFAYVALLEAGIGNTTLQALYKPLAQKKRGDINSILAATDYYYKRTSILYFLAVIVLALLYPFTVDSNISKGVISLVILLTGIPGIINFLFQGKYKVLLQAEGKLYFVNIVTTMITILTNIARIVLVLLGFSIVAVQLSYCVLQIFQMLIYTIYIRKKYKWLNLSAKRNMKALSQKNSVLVHQISGLIFSNTDNLVLSFFCGFNIVSVYSIYSLISGTISTLINTLNDSFVYKLGYVYNKSFDQFEKTYDLMECVIGTAAFSLFTVLYLLMTPFISIYMKGADINYIDEKLVLLFVIYQILNVGRKVPQNVINVAGHFEKTKNRALLEAGINLVLTLVLVPFWGIYGALIGTIAALLYRTNDIIIYANKQILKRPPVKTYLRWGANIILLILLSVVIKPHMTGIDSYSDFIIYGTILSVVSLIMFTILSIVTNYKVYSKLIGYIICVL